MNPPNNVRSERLLMIFSWVALVAVIVILLWERGG